MSPNVRLERSGPVATVILERLPPTILLMTASLSFAFFFGLLFGVIAARGVNRWPDTLISTLGLVFYATPLFWIALIYAAIGTIITHFIGRRLIPLNFEQERYEANFRYMLARLRDCWPDWRCSRACSRRCFSTTPSA